MSPRGRWRVSALAVGLVLVLLAASAPAGARAMRSTVPPSGERTADPSGSAPIPRSPVGPSASAAGNVAFTSLLNYNATWPGNFPSSTDGWLATGGTYLPSIQEVWVGEVSVGAGPNPTPPPAPVVRLDPGTNAFLGTIPSLTDVSAIAYDGATGVVYTANPRNDTVGVFDPTSMSWTHPAVPVGALPLALAVDPAAHELFVANEGSSNVTIINTSSDSPLSVSLAVAGADGLVVDSRDGLLYVISNSSLRVSCFNISTLSAQFPIPLAVHPGGVSYLEGVDVLAVTQPGLGLLDLYNASTGASIGTGVLGGAPFGIVNDSASNGFLVANSTGANVWGVNVTTTAQVGAPIAVGPSPAFFVSDVGTGWTYVWSGADRNFSEVSVSNYSVLGHTPTLGPIVTSVVGMPGEREVLEGAPVERDVLVINSTTGLTARPPLPVPVAPHSLAFDPGTGLVVVAGEGGVLTMTPTSGTIVRWNSTATGYDTAALIDSPDQSVWLINSVAGLLEYDLPNLTLVRSIALGTGLGGVRSLALDPGTDEIFAIDNLTGTSQVVAVDGATGAVVGTAIAAGANLTSLAFDPADNSVYALGASVSLINASTNAVEGAPIALPRHSFTGTILFDGTRNFVYAETMTGPNVTGNVTVLDGSSVAASESSSTTVPVGLAPLGAATVGIPGGGLDAVWVANALSGTSSVLASSPPSITYFASVPSRIDLGTRATFEAVASGGTGPIVWSYSGLPAGCPSTNASELVCTPTAPGNYSVLVTAVDALGTSASASTTLSVLPGLFVGATFNATLFPITDVHSVASGFAFAGGGAPPYQYSWSLGAGGSDTLGPSATITYSSPGVYLLNLTVTDSLGFRTTTTWAVLVNPAPTLTVRDSAVIADANQSTALVAGGEGGTQPYRYIWTLGSSVVGLTPNVSLVWPNPGTFAMNVTLTDALGEVARATVGVTVHPPMAGRFTVSKPGGGGLVAGELLDFNASLFGGTPAYLVTWVFGDGAVGVGPNTTHSYLQAGTYTVRVLVADAVNASLEVNLTVSVGGPVSVASAGTPAFPLGLFLGVIIGVATGTLATFVASRRSRERPPPPPSPYVPPSRPNWKED